MQLTGYALRMSIFIGEDDVRHHKPLHRVIIERARDAGLAGATVLRGCEGYGIHAMIHTTRLLSMSEDLPITILIVDREDKIRAFLPELDELIGEGAVLLDEVEVLSTDGVRRP